MTTMRRQLEEMRRPELFDEAIEEITRVRADFGYPIVVTPYAQFLVTQAVFNVMARHRGAERYADVPDEIVRYFLGHFGEPPAPPDPDLRDRVLSSPRAAELRKVEPLSLEGAREKFGAQISDEELLLRLTMPPEQVDAMLAGAAPRRRRGRQRRAGIRPGRAPAARARAPARGRLPARGEGRHARGVAQGGELRCGLRTRAGSSSTSTGRSSSARSRTTRSSRARPRPWRRCAAPHGRS